MQFLTQDNMVRVPLEKIKDVLEYLTWFLNQSAVSARLFPFSSGTTCTSRPVETSCATTGPQYHNCILDQTSSNRDQFLKDVPINTSIATHTMFTDAAIQACGITWNRKKNRPNSTPYQCPRNDGHLTCSERSSSCFNQHHSHGGDRQCHQWWTYKQGELIP